MCQRLDIREPELNEIGDCQWPGLRDVPQRVPSRIAILIGVGQRAYAHAIQHDPYNSRKTHRLSKPQLSNASDSPTLSV
jgi:hypothetical protein